MPGTVLVSSTENESLLDSTSSSPSFTSSGAIPGDSEKLTHVTKPYLSSKLLAAHIIHGSLLTLHVVALVASIKGWTIPVNFMEISIIQTGITAALQVAFILINGILLSIVREIAIDTVIRHPPTLGILHLRLKAWSTLWTSLTANWAYINSKSSLQGSQCLKRILFYTGACALLQISSSSIFGVDYNLNSSSILSDIWWPYIIQGNRFGEYDQLWPSHVNISSADKQWFPPATMIAAQTMFAGRVNDTRYPGFARATHTRHH
ncbi:hypothetical protein J3R30DRAFT_750365 [Lentinula aciculospora]|uniref:Uncharacterized protein n=1 Tax=Lentinula aciculospora TaxID=153920 RepID=A0A9W9DJX7_9AGAR|nr:hypothetical protein J3R30DRAFT_750365 [Lentinula aciculospora]